MGSLSDTGGYGQSINQSTIYLSIKQSINRKLDIPGVCVSMRVCVCVTLCHVVHGPTRICAPWQQVVGGCVGVLQGREARAECTADPNKVCCPWRMGGLQDCRPRKGYPVPQKIEIGSISTYPGMSNPL